MTLASDNVSELFLLGRITMDRTQRSDQKRGATLVKTNGEASTSNSTNDRNVRDLFHEDAQVDRHLLNPGSTALN